MPLSARLPCSGTRRRIGARGDQFHHHFRIAIHRRQSSGVSPRMSAFALAAAKARTDFHVAHRHRPEQRRLAIVARGVHIGARRDQIPNHLHIAVGHRP